MADLSDEDLIEVWAGRVELRLIPGVDEYTRGFRGAFTTLLVRCANVSQFVESAVAHVEREGCVITGIENLFPLGAGHLELTEAVIELAIRTREYPMQWTTFHMFKDN